MARGNPVPTRYRFRVVGTSICFPFRSEWRLAAMDAVAAGYADWRSADSISWHLDSHGYIEEDV